MSGIESSGRWSVRTSCLSPTTDHCVSEVELESELDDARPGAGLRDATEGRGHRDVAVRVGEVGPVEEVEELRAELAAHGLRERQVLHHREVHVLLPRPRQDVAAGV